MYSQFIQNIGKHLRKMTIHSIVLRKNSNQKQFFVQRNGLSYVNVLLYFGLIDDKISTSDGNLPVSNTLTLSSE